MVFVVIASSDGSLDSLTASGSTSYVKRIGTHAPSFVRWRIMSIVVSSPEVSSE